MKNSLIVITGVIIILTAIFNTMLDFNLIPGDLLAKLQWQVQQVENHQVLDNSFVTKESLDKEVSYNQQIESLSQIKKEEPQRTMTSFAQQTVEAGFKPLMIQKQDLKIPEIKDQKLPDVVPLRILVPAIHLSAPIVSAKSSEVTQGGQLFTQWEAPDEFAAGWQTDSAFLGQKGNTVLNGHHNIDGEVFKDLVNLVVGDEISILGDNLKKYNYVVSNVMILPERDVTVEEKLANARWIMPSSDERLTLITCWPYYSNTHRLIIVAVPDGVEELITEEIAN